MTLQDDFQTIRQELEAGVMLPKCQKCGCMGETRQYLAAGLPTIATQAALALHQEVSSWRERMRAIQYACLGCEHCYPAGAQNALARAFPSLDQLSVVGCELQRRDDGWPPVVGEYFALDKTAPVAVSSLADARLAERVRQPAGTAVLGPHNGARFLYWNFSKGAGWLDRLTRLC